MKLITRDTDYALRALMHIARSKQDVVAVTYLVRITGIPRPFLRKILQILQKNGMLSSLKGKGGGFSLKRSPGHIRVTDIMKIFQGSLALNQCILKKDVCPHIRTCILKKKIDIIEKSVIRGLKKITLAKLL